MFGFGPQGTEEQLQQLRMRSLGSMSDARTSSSALSLEDSDDSADDQLLDDEPLEMPELFESVGNISYVPKEDAMPLPAPIERTYTKTYAGVFYVNVRYQLLTAVVSK